MTRWALIVSLASLVAACGDDGSTAEPVAPEDVLLSDGILNIAHRGGAAVRPEHTLLAYDGALDDGADVLELDVHATSEGVLVVMHDDTVDRTTDGTGLIRELTFAEIGQLDAGYDFTTDDGATFPYRGTGLVVPTLEEVFQTHPDVPYVIEIKQEEPSIVDSFVEVVREYGIQDQMVGAAFSDDVVRELRAVAPEIETSMGEADTIRFYTQSLGGVGPGYEPPARFLQVPTEFRGIAVFHDDFVSSARALGLKIHVWTINDPTEMRTLLEMGVDGLITDYPARAREVIDAFTTDSTEAAR